MAPALCPIWRQPLPTAPKELWHLNLLVYSSRAGGVYVLESPWADQARAGAEIPQFTQATPREKANLSHWIYRYNLEAGLLTPDDHTRSSRHAVVDEVPREELARRAPTLDYDTTVEWSNRRPSTTDRRLCLMRELLVQMDMRLPPEDSTHGIVYADYAGFRWAAAACAEDSEWREFLEHFQKRGWIVGDEWSDWDEPTKQYVEHPLACSLDARLWVADQLRAQGTGHRVFVAMWFHECLDQAYKEGFARGIELAGYAPHRVDQETLHSHKLDDRVLADIRQSRIMVADFTCEEFTRTGSNSPEGRLKANVHYEAGFTYGLGLPVIYTCRADCKKYLGFDTRQINHIFWEDEDDLARKLQERLEGQFGPGPAQHTPSCLIVRSQSRFNTRWQHPRSVCCHRCNETKRVGLKQARR